MNKTTKELIEEFKETFLPPDFKWRKGQVEVIIQIINAYKNKHKFVILDAPVGSGKSIIAMAVSWILNQYNKRGYILASDISLQEQYEKDFNKFNLNWGSVKGIDNYLCIDNMEKNSLGTCRIRNIVPRIMSCYNECPYFSARGLASESNTALLNYSYWLIMQNYVNVHGDDDVLFPPRDFTIADEGHKILNIVQNHFSPKFDKKTIEKLEKLTIFFDVHNMKDHQLNLQSFINLKKELYKTENQEQLFNILQKIELILESYISTSQVLKDRVAKDYSKTEPPKEWKETLRLSDWLKDFHCKIEDYNDIISKTSSRNLIKNPGMDNDITFNCLEESYLMNKYFHAHTGFTILMSATFADPNDYMKNMSIKNAVYIKMESTFDFTKSPIYFYNKHRMSYSQIERNLPWMYDTINNILDKHKNENGIIHTASYNLTMKVHNNLSKENKKRVLIYDGTIEKRKALESFKKNKTKILMGPSLLEGLDLKDDHSRFQIFAKIPYLSLADRFVKTKLSINPNWYRWAAIKNILQGVGRSVRSENDWAVTYILDAGLADLIHKNRRAFPVKEFMSRIKVIE